MSSGRWLEIGVEGGMESFPAGLVSENGSIPGMSNPEKHPLRSP